MSDPGFKPLLGARRLLRARGIREDGLGGMSVRWSPGGERLGVIVDFDLYVLDADATEFPPEPVLGRITSFCWSPDGQVVAGTPIVAPMVTVRDLRDGTSRDIDPWDPIVGASRPPNAPGENAIDWHPAGDRIAVLRSSQPESGVDDIAICDCINPANGELLWSVPAPTLNHGFYDMPQAMAWSPDGRMLAASTTECSIVVLDAAGGSPLAHLVGHTNGIRHVAWSPDGAMLVSAGADATLHVWDARELSAGQGPAFVLEGHRTGVASCAFLDQGAVLLSAGDDGLVRVWRVPSWEVVAESHVGQALPSRYADAGVALHPDARALAVPYESDPEIEIIALDPASWTDTPVEATERYVNATVLLVGDSGVGKSGLGLALTGRPFEATESTHARHIWTFSSEEAVVDGVKELREVFLWDLAGQPGYRLVHQLHLGQAVIALVVFDSRSEIDPFAGVSYWTRALRQAQRRESLDGPGVCNFLVAARVDRGGTPVSQARIDEVVAEGDFDEVFTTSAKAGTGVEELRAALQRAVPWDSLPRVISSELLLSIKRFVVGEKEDGRLLSTPQDLLAAFMRATVARSDGETVTGADLLSGAVAVDGGSEETPLALFETCVGRLESQALVRRLSFGGLVLLQPELLDAYAAHIVNAARTEPDGLGSIAEDSAAEVVEAAEDEVGLTEKQRELLAFATVEELLRQEVVLRENTESGPQLVFPSELTRDWPEAPNLPRYSIVYRFSGAISHAYATLVVRLSRSGRFTIKEMWRTAVKLETPWGDVCGLVLRGAEGEGELGLFFGDRVSDEMKASFDDYVEAHLLRRAVPDSVVRVEHCFCQTPDCGVKLSEDQVELRRARGHSDALCPVCEERVSLVGLRQRRKASDGSVLGEMNRSADAKRAIDVNATVLDAKSATGEFDVFLCHNSEDKEEIKALAVELRERYGLRSWVDEWELRPGLPWQRTLEEEIDRIRCAAVFIGESGLGPWQRHEIDALLRGFVDRGTPVIPVMLPEAPQRPDLPLFLKGLMWVDFRRDEPPPLNQLVWGITGMRPEEKRRRPA